MDLRNDGGATVAVMDHLIAADPRFVSVANQDWTQAR
jgi:hypothetical protein